MSCTCVVCTEQMAPEPSPNETFLARVKEVVARVNYRRDRYVFEVDQDRANPGGRVFIQLKHWRPDADTGQMAWGGGGKRYLSPYMTDSEIVRVCFGAAIAYEEHEVREFFTYKGARVFGPHIDVEALIEVAERLDIR